MTLHAALPAAAALASAYLFFTAPSRLWPALALLAAAVELALAEGWLRLAIHPNTLQLGLGAALLVPALVVWWRAPGKGVLTASTIVGFVGLVQLALAGLARL